MFTNESYIKAFDGDADAAKEDIKIADMHWRKGGQIGNLPLATLLGLAIKYPKGGVAEEEIEMPEPKKKGRPAGSKNKPKELANV